jgi:chemotaxis methyl-accepting protein methylase
VSTGLPDTMDQTRRALHRREREIRRDLGELEAHLAELGPGDCLPGLYLMIQAGGGRALLSAAQVEAVAPAVDLRPAPGTPTAAGVALVGGRSLLVVDLASLLGAGRAAPARGTLVVFPAPVPVALLVDSAVPSPAAPDLVASAAGGNGGAPRGSLARVGDEVLPVLRLEMVLAAVGIPAGLDAEEPPEVSRQLARLEVRLERRGLQLCTRLRDRVRGWMGDMSSELGTGAPDLVPEVLAADAPSLCALLEAATSGETYFFRHPQQFRALGRLLIGSSEPGRTLHLWSAGCSTGEEPYSLAALLVALGRTPGRDRILATDVSEGALAHAREGLYGRWSLRGAAPDLERLVADRPGVTRLPPGLRAAVRFERHDVRDPPLQTGFDAVLCRGVLPLLDADDVEPVLRRLLSAVRPGGYLVLAPAETPLAAALELEQVESEGAVLLRRPWSRAAAVSGARSAAAR